MRKLCLLLLFGLVAIISRAQTPQNATVLGFDRLIYTDSLPHSSTRTYYVAADITLSGNIRLQNVRFLLKSNFRRNQIADLQYNKNIHKAGGTAYGTNIQLCGANVILQNCMLTAADSGMWGGLYVADSSSVLQLNGCRISDSYHGIVQLTESCLKVENSTFRNNYVSLQLAGRHDTLRHNNFSSRPSAMKMPLDSVSLDEHFISQMHLKNTDGQELYLLSKQFENNLFDKAVVSMFVTEKHKINIKHCVFGNCEVSSIYVRNGELNVIQSDFNLKEMKNSSFGSRQLPFKIPAAGQCFGMISEHGQSDLSGVNMTETDSQHIGYYGFNGDINAVESEFVGLKTGILLEGTKGSYTINNVVFTNNLTGIHINRTDASNVSLGIRCNDFVSTTSLARTGIRLQGNMAVNFDGFNSILGGCDATGNTPNGNEVRNLRSHSNLVLPTNFTFINSSLASNIEYRRYKNENVKDVSNSLSISFLSCEIDGINETCRTAAGILNRQAAPSVQATLGNNAPNPATHETQIGYTLPEEAVGKAQIVVYAPVSGKAVFTQTLQETEGNVTVNLSRLASGIYPYVLLLDGKVVQSRKLAVIK
ncbi:Por secretion system C-terminal sorting domain-containing protein [Flexibacter flexilis DSM 6793]|uniref:Por secretion system C-terminal sorting domain-containing protein n=1 Tax=Flexibacter flexilis DSM 6793 TaxID=927664 RepID=A0A1I1FQM5_9BACT|nr:T9SS type A sorting domain-containing protein [Flexibacter flexilis]SFC01747.1 Por secretion system C-terminal sorting domain-containing protein [Flexibacter flexilis DSM 6793]